MIGRTIAHYRITAKLGEGGMGEVVSHHDTKLRLELANVLRQSLVFDSWPEQDILRAVLTIAGENKPFAPAIRREAPSQLSIPRGFDTGATREISGNRFR